MEIGKFNQMKAYLLKPKRLFTKKQDTIGGGTIQGDNLGSRSGFQEPYVTQKIIRGGKEFERVYTKKPGSKAIFDPDNTAIEKWRKSLTKKNPLPWTKFLEKNYGEKAATPIRKRAQDVKDFNPAEEYRVKLKENRINTIKELYDKHQKSDKFLYDQKAISNILGVVLNRKDHADELKLIDTFDSREDKIRNAFDKIVDGNMELYRPKKTAASNKTQNVIINMISDMVSNPELSARYSTEGRVINKALENHKPYLDIKDDFDYFVQNEASNFIGSNFKEGLEYAKYKRGGLDIKNTGNFSKVYAVPEKNVLEFAIRNAYLNFKNKKKSDVKLFFLKEDGTKGKPVDFNALPTDRKSRARIINADKIGFTYEGDFYNKKNVRSKGYKADGSGVFNEVYEMSQKGRIRVPDPNNPGQEIPLKQLLEDTGDKLTIGHNDAKGGVAGSPFNDLRLEGGKFNASIFQVYKNVQDPKAREMILNNLQGKFEGLEGPEYEEAFIKNKIQLAKDTFDNPDLVSQLPTYYKGAGQQVLTDMGKTFFDQSESFQKEVARVAGINLEDYAANRNKFRTFLFNEFCEIGGARQRNALGGRIGFSDGTVCSPETVARGMQKSIEAGDSAKVLRALKEGSRLLSRVVAPIDVAIEGAFALPYLLEGDLEGAKQATTLGFFGWGKDLQEQVGDRFGENSPAFGALEKQRAIDLQVEGMFDMDQALLRGEKAGIFIKNKDDSYTQKKDLTVADQDSLKLANNLFKTGVEKTLEAKNLFTNAAPKILGPQNESTALSQLGVFSDELRSGVLDEKIGDPWKITQLFKSLNISQPAERTVEGFISTGGLGTEFPLASNVKQSELIQDRINKLKELRIGDLPFDIAAQVPAYEAAQVPSEEERELRLRRNLGIADPQLVQQYEQMGFPQLVPFLPSYANGGRIGLKEGLTPEQQGSMGPVFTTSDPKEAAKEVIRRAIEIQDADIPVSEKLKISLQGLDNVTLQGVMKILGGELYFGAGKKGSDKGIGFSFYKQFANGGRIKYAEGPEDPSKRKFLKNVGIGGGIVGGFMTGLLNLVDLFKGGKKGVVATKAAESEAEKIFLDLVDVVKNKGILKRLDDRFETKVGELYEYKGVKVLEDGENIEVRFETDKGAPAVVEYRKPGYEVDPDAQTSVQTPGEFIYEAQEIGKYGPDGDVDIDFVEEIVDPIENIKSMAKEKK